MQIACRACRRPLNRIDHPGGRQSWVHALGQQEDGTHEPQPVLTDPDYRCDLCNDEPVTSLLVVSGTVRITPISMSDGPWALCSTCTELITANKWQRLLNHVTTRFRGQGVHLFPHLIADIRRLHGQLRRLAVGPPVPLATNPDPHTPGPEQETPAPESPSGPV
jgi:hypothetical protein